MATNKPTKVPSERAIRALLERYACPVPYHEVRTRFLGNIATPQMASPIGTAKGLWGGQLPPFDSIDRLNELLGVLVNGLWSELTQHQKRSKPFRLTRVPLEPSIENLGRFGRVRQEELDGFIEGLFNGQEDIELPQRAHEAVTHLSDIRAMMAGVVDLTSRGSEGEHCWDIETTFGRLRELSRIMQTEIHETVLSCTRARRQMLAGIPTGRPTVH